jgi:hypothetical protein
VRIVSVAFGGPPKGTVTVATLETDANVSGGTPAGPTATSCTSARAVVVTVPSSSTRLSLREVDAPVRTTTASSADPDASPMACGWSEADARSTTPLAGPASWPCSKAASRGEVSDGGSCAVTFAGMLWIEPPGADVMMKASPSGPRVMPAA